MPRIPRPLLIALSLPVLLFGGAFLYGAYLGVTGQLEPPPAADATPAAADSSALAPESSPGPEAGPPRALAPLPEPLDAKAAANWLAGQRLLWAEGEELRGDSAAFAHLDVKDAAALHHALRRGGKEYAALRLLLFAWCSYLPPAERLEFASDVGIAFRPKGELLSRSYIGELTGLFFMQDGDRDSIFARAVRAYCEVIGDDEVVQALRDFGVIVEDPSVGEWHMRVDEKMQAFDPDTLLAIREPISLFFGLGDRKYLRERLADLAASKRDA